MALEGALAGIPGLRGYLAGEDRLDRQMGQRQQMAIGLAQLLQKQRDMEQEAQLAPLKAEFMKAQAAQMQALAAQRQQEQEHQQALPGLIKQATGEDGQLDWNKLSGILAQAPGGLKTAMDLRRAEEDRAARVAQGEAVTQQRMAAANQQHEIRLAQAQTAQEKAAEQARHNRVLEVLSAQTKAIAASRGGGGPRMEPFKISVDGQNVQGWRDRAGNVFGPDGKVLQNYKPEITASDQNIARKNAEERSAIETVDVQLRELEGLSKSNPRSVAGPLSGLTRGVEAVGNFVMPGSVGLQATTAQQLIRSVISNLPKTGRLSNYQQQEMRRLFEDGLAGNAESLQKGIELVRQNLTPRQSAVDQPTGRSTPTKEIDFSQLPRSR
jgi:hypothetical protein